MLQSSASHTHDHTRPGARRRVPVPGRRPRRMPPPCAGTAGATCCAARRRATACSGALGNDRLFGGRGHDLLVGGAGRDVARGGRGNDRIRMRDGERDRVTCGRGRDRAVLDSADKILDARPTNPNGRCERVSRPSASPMRSWPPPETSPTASRAPRSPRACSTDCPGPSRCSVTSAYENGTPDEFARCYEPTWGRHKARTRPAVGNHEYGTPGAAGYFGVLRRRGRRARQGLVQLRPRRLARRGAELQLHSRRRLPGRVRAGALAARRPGRKPARVHARLHAPSARSAPATCTAAARRSSRCGARSRTTARSWCWRATTTTTSASPHRRPPARSTSSGACVSSSWARAGGPCARSAQPRAEQRGARQHHLGRAPPAAARRPLRLAVRGAGPGSSFADAGTGACH